VGKLLFLKDFRITERDPTFGHQGMLDPSWYFEGAYWNSGSGGGGRWEFDIARSFPFPCAIHESHFGVTSSGSMYGATDAQKALKIRVRKFIERNCQGVCIYSQKEMDYAYAYEIDKEHRHLYHYSEFKLSKVQHRYWLFNFEYDADAIAFKLAFTEVSDISTRNPTFDCDEESIARAVELQRDRPWVIAD
jgi:hypothetical protein